jgi:hypothetical protein
MIRILIFVKFSSSNCNYYEKGGYECPIYENNSFKLHLPNVDMHCYTLIGCDSFIYNIPMHRKKGRLRYYLLNTLQRALLCFKLLGVFIGMITPWDPGIYHLELFLTMRRGQSRSITLYNIIPLLKRYEKPSYMAIKKALCGRQPGYISFEVFFLCPCCIKNFF